MRIASTSILTSERKVAKLVDRQEEQQIGRLEEFERRSKKVIGVRWWFMVDIEREGCVRRRLGQSASNKGFSTRGWIRVVHEQWVPSSL
ncbi:hypothetical protein H5410_018198 [Solanum commersonii]|uniref:Uncharacterized protein n=1 Tax=Solanum commersonii TaxID=4109 RepID=A0A9J6A192_SOLCO|nr:hypothetical protein H5410_018198 [Solanum commersonii]